MRLKVTVDCVCSSQAVLATGSLFGVRRCFKRAQTINAHRSHQRRLELLTQIKRALQRGYTDVRDKRERLRTVVLICLLAVRYCRFDWNGATLQANDKTRPLQQSTHALCTLFARLRVIAFLTGSEASVEQAPHALPSLFAGDRVVAFALVGICASSISMTICCCVNWRYSNR